MEKGLNLWPGDIRIHGLAKGFFKGKEIQSICRHIYSHLMDNFSIFHRLNQNWRSLNSIRPQIHIYMRWNPSCLISSSQPLLLVFFCLICIIMTPVKCRVGLLSHFNEAYTGPIYHHRHRAVEYERKKKKICVFTEKFPFFIFT